MPDGTAKSVTEPIEGYTLKYHYHDVEGTRLGEIPNWAKVGNKVILTRVKDDEYYHNAVQLLLVPQRKRFGYMMDDKTKDMVLDYLDRGDKVVALISSFKKLKLEYSVRLDIAFFKKN